MKTDVKSRQAKGSRKAIAVGVHDQKREHILAVAEELFFRNGYAGTTMADIVNELGVTKPFLYYYFPGKSDIFETLCWRASHACLTAMHFQADDERRAIEKLHEGLHRFAAANVVFFKSGTFAYREGGALSAAFLKKLKTMARRFYNELCGLLEQARNDGDLEFDDTKLTALAIGSIAGFMYTWYKPNGRIGADDMVRELTRILMKIAGAQTAPSKRLQKGKRRNN